jgi:hypothetical protein
MIIELLYECQILFFTLRGEHIGGTAFFGYWWESQKEEDHWEDKGVGGWTIL